MKRTHLLSTLVFFGLGAALGAVLFGLPLVASAQGPVGTTFTYQGRLLQNNQYVNGNCDFQFGLYADPAGGAPLGSGVQTVTNVPLTNGYFTADLDFGVNVFAGDQRYLEVEVRCPAGAGGYTLLSGRVNLLATPYAIYALNTMTATTALNVASVPWNNITGKPAGFNDNIDNDLLYNLNCGSLGPTGKTLSDERVANWSGGSWRCYWDQDTDTLRGLSCTNGQVAKMGPVNWGCSPDNNYSYYAGTGLDLTGSFTFSVSPAYRLPQGCGDQQLARWNSTSGSWECQAAYSAGTGLSQAGSQFSIAPTYQLPQTCSNSQLTRWNGSTWVCSNDIAYSAGDGIDATAFNTNHIIQVRVADFAGSGLQDDGANNLRIAPNGVGMAEIRDNDMMGAAADPNISAAVVAGDNWSTPANFSPQASGHCLVIASVDVSSSGSHYRLGAWVRVAYRVGGNSYTGNNWNYMESGGGELNNSTVSDVISVSPGSIYSFGCHLYANDSSWHDDESWRCSVSYLCM
jgi:hypothetical protein